MKTLKNFFFLLLFLQTVMVFSQNYTLNENFNNNTNNWVLDNNTIRETKIFNGRLYFEHKRNETSWIMLSPKITNATNYEISTSIQKIKGVDDYGFGLILKATNGKMLELIIASKGFYGIGIYENNNYKTLKKWTTSKTVKPGNFATNDFKIKKKGEQFQFFINNQLIDSHNIDNFNLAHAGFVIYRNQKISADYIKIKKEEKTQIINNNKQPSSETILTENFTDNQQNWSMLKNEYVTYDMHNGMYYLAHKLKEGGYSSTILKSFDTTKNFEIATKITKINGVSNYPYGLMWGKSQGNSLRFFITDTGYYKIVRTINGKEEVIFKWAKSPYINKNNGVSNVLAVRKERNHYKFYINNNYVNEIDFEPFYGNNLGFVLYNQQKIGIDYLTIKYIKNNSNYNSIVASALKVPVNESFYNNANNWVEGNTNSYNAKINNGAFEIERKEKGGLFFKNEVALNTQKDFIIETELSKISGNNEEVYGISFGRKNSANEYGFFITNAGNYLFRKLENNDYSPLIPWTYSKYIQQNKYNNNIIKIVKTGNLLRFYINNSFVNEYPFKPFFGNKIGFTVYNLQKIKVNYLNITYATDNNYNNPPVITITEPFVEVERGFKIVKTKNITVKGTATDPDGIYEININGIEANVAENGNFTATVPLKYGKNQLVVSATDLKQAIATKKFTIKRNANTSYNSSEIINNSTITTNFGTYHALIIGVSEYESEQIKDLNNEPVKDAKKLANVLTKQYNFSPNNVTVLTNPKENEITRAFYQLRKKVNSNDNLLVFFAGHGIFQDEIGSWLPADANVDFGENLLGNSQVKDYLKAIKTKHTLLISDACFSGSIFNTRSVTAPKSIQRKLELPSRKAITSGTLKTVPNQSVFFKYLIKRLEENKNKYLPVNKLFNDIEDAVINNSANKPQYGTIHGIGDEGGDFVFIKK